MKTRKKVLVAPDSFKGSISSIDICKLFENELEESMLDIIKCPMADGGEGSIDIIAHNIALEKVDVKAYNPAFKLISAYFYFDSNTNTAYIESAKIIGLHLINRKTNGCFVNSSYGLGELIEHAIRLYATTIYLFIGGSATNDAGVGMLNALGVNFYDKYQNIIEPVGKNLINISDIDDSNFILNNKSIKIITACDVDNVFFGENGAARIYAKQKGATDKEIEILDLGLKNIAELIYSTYNIKLQNVNGSGAAGGIGGACKAFFNSKIKYGAEILMEMTKFNNYIENTDYLISGEGKIDLQTLNNKLIYSLCKKANKYSVKTILISGIKGVNEDVLLKELKVSKIIYLADNQKDIVKSIRNPGARFIKAINNIKETIENEQI